MPTRSDQEPILNTDELMHLETMLAAHRAQQAAEKLAAARTRGEAPAAGSQKEPRTDRELRQASRAHREQLMQTIKASLAAKNRQQAPGEASGLSDC